LLQHILLLLLVWLQHTLVLTHTQTRKNKFTAQHK